MNYFDTYVSNTLAASGNQFWFGTNGKKKHSRVFYRVFEGGTYDYSLFFTNTVDSTFHYGAESRCNLICGEWEIHSAAVAVVPASETDLANAELQLQPLTFGGKTELHVLPGMEFTSDPVVLTASKGDYLCLEMRVTGDCIPCLREIVIPAFSETEGKFSEDCYVPLADMFGCNRNVRKKIAFFGDSITEGIGAPVNSYKHWNAVAAELIGNQYAYWNLGLGYGRAADAATDKAWLKKAKHADLCTVCFGVNDIAKDYTAKQVTDNLRKIVTILKNNGVKVVLFTIPPFDFTGDYRTHFMEANQCIREELRYLADGFFDFDKVIGAGTYWEKAPYGGHPGIDGCRLLAEELVRTVDFDKLLEP